MFDLALRLIVDPMTVEPHCRFWAGFCPRLSFPDAERVHAFVSWKSTLASTSSARHRFLEFLDLHELDASS